MRTTIIRQCRKWTSDYDLHFRAGGRRGTQKKLCLAIIAEMELRELSCNWSSIEKVAKDRQGWRNFVATLCTTRHDGQ